MKRRFLRMKKKMPGSRTARVLLYQGNDSWPASLEAKFSEKRPMSMEVRAMLQVEMDAVTCVWHIWKDELPTGTRRLRGTDKIYDPVENETWMIVDADLKQLDTRYHCNCILVPA